MARMPDTIDIKIRAKVIPSFIPLPGEVRTWNAERNGWGVLSDCWTCGHRVSYFVDEDGTPRDITPVEDVRDVPNPDWTFEDG